MYRVYGEIGTVIENSSSSVKSMQVSQHLTSSLLIKVLSIQVIVLSYKLGLDYLDYRIHFRLKRHKAHLPYFQVSSQQLTSKVGHWERGVIHIPQEAVTVTS